MNKTIFTILMLISIFLGIYFAFILFRAQTPRLISPISPPQKNTAPTSKFVTAEGKDLYLDGKLFRSIGVNRYNLLTKSDNGSITGCANTFSENEIDTMFSQLHDMGVTSIRFWLFQSFTKSGDDTSRFDYVLSEADKYNMKVIPVFENHWADCTEGGVKDPLWYSTGYTTPYGGYPLSLKDYIGKIVPKYKDNTTIMTWEIMNEANSKDNQGLYNFAGDVSSYVKSLDANHLVSISLASKEESAADFANMSAITTIDIVAYHDYDNETKPIPPTLQDAITVIQQHAKPLVVGEAGIKQTVPNRESLLAAKMQAFFANGGDVYLLWAYGEPYVTDDGFNFTYTDTLAKVVQQTAEEIKN